MSEPIEETVRQLKCERYHDDLEDERRRTCGQHPTLGDVTRQGSRACGRLLAVIDLFRCADCQTAYCRACIRRHFADEAPEAREALRQAELAANADFNYDEPEDHDE